MINKLIKPRNDIGFIDPKTGLEYVPYETPLVNAIDKLIEIAKKNESKDSIQREKDWETMEWIVKLWSYLYPDHFYQFSKHMKELRSHANMNGVAKEHGGAMIQHQLEIPQRLYQMIGVVFPYQKFDKKFVAQFASKLPMFKGADKL